MSDPEQTGTERSDRARFECTCGSSTTFPKESFAKLHWLAGRFGYKNIESAIDDLRDCCDSPDYMETRGWEELREDDDGLRTDGGEPLIVPDEDGRDELVRCSGDNSGSGQPSDCPECGSIGYVTRDTGPGEAECIDEDCPEGVYEVRVDRLRTDGGTDSTGSERRRTPQQLVTKRFDKFGHGRFTVELKGQDSTFGLRVDHEFSGRVMLMGLPRMAGWRAISSVCLHGQTYVEKIEDWLEDRKYAREVAVLEVDTGEWQTVWEGGWKGMIGADWINSGERGCLDCRAVTGGRFDRCEECREDREEWEWTQFYARAAPIGIGEARRNAEALSEEVDR